MSGRSQNADDLWRWLVGGLVAGAAMLGLAVAAYEFGYDQGRDHQPAMVHPSVGTTSTTPNTSPLPAAATVTATPELVARGKALYSTDGCSACHSLTGAAGAGPTFRGLAGSTGTLANDQMITADDAYLQRSISDPDSQIVKGYRAGLMTPAIAGFDLSRKPSDIRALVAFIKSQK
jgi:cytochrome c2